MLWEIKNFIYCAILTSIVCIFLCYLFNVTYKEFNHNQYDNPDINMKIIKKLDHNEHTNNFLIKINNHIYHMSINKVMNNVFFYHDLSCKFCKKNNNFIPYTCSILDGYSYNMMKDK